ncbi:anti-sigma-V factor rsiV [Romboutsia weinsteinii]|uniref:Anti-sigma-V factor rsiV n=1 Tax=Romboutsia weinsteinii TaxID=2020949 RepID=A0A371J0C1_9FIRM|nr:anti-sigma-V factor rsiV [Romboutsia weinsteinii]RDY26210.1 anti-sigma-V factor rsiV [Romboutsia weinsteinii]
MNKNENLEKLKDKYKNIEIPDRLDRIVNDAMSVSKTKKNKIIKSSALAASISILVGIVNLVPTFANTLESIPGIGGVIKIINFRNYRINENGYDVSIDVPRIEGLEDKDLEYKLNKKFEERGKELYNEYLKEMKQLKSEGIKVKEYVKYWYDVKTDNEDILSIVIYKYSAQGSSNITRKFYNIDKKNNTVLTLEGMFEGTDYIDAISQNIKQQMKERMENNREDVYWLNDKMVDSNFNKIDKNQEFYINDKNQLVICFNKYDVAPGSEGLVEFVIPQEITNQIIYYQH